MKKNPKKIALMGLAASVLFGATACGSNRQPAVYGPAPSPDDNTTEITTEINEEPTVYGPPEMFESQFVPEENIPEDVYGPPMFFESAEAEPSSAPTEGNP